MVEGYVGKEFCGHISRCAGIHWDSWPGKLSSSNFNSRWPCTKSHAVQQNAAQQSLKPLPRMLYRSRMFWRVPICKKNKIKNASEHLLGCSNGKKYARKYRKRMRRAMRILPVRSNPYRKRLQ